MKQLKTQIYSLAFGGEGVGKVEGKICFVKDALPGEEVIFNVIKDTSNYIRGELIEILTASPDRVKPVCRYYGKCGGCVLQHVSHEKELLYKKAQVEELMKRFAGIKDFVCGSVIASSDPYGYRNSVTLHKGPGGYGYYARDGRTVIEIKECSLAVGAINEMLPIDPAGSKEERLTLKSDHNGHIWRSDRTGERFFTDRYADTDMIFSPKAFSQCNRDMSIRAAGVLADWTGRSGDDTVFFDVYCGMGFFSFLLKHGPAVKVGMDSERVSVDCAKTTVKRNGLKNIKFYKCDAEKDFFRFFEKNKAEKNIIFLDPPRKGLGKDLLEGLMLIEGVDRMYYMSCDPATLARDTAVLVGSGAWKLGRSSFFDMFPRTKHIEMLVEFEKNNYRRDPCSEKK